MTPDDEDTAPSGVWDPTDPPPLGTEARVEYWANRERRLLAFLERLARHAELVKGQLKKAREHRTRAMDAVRALENK